MVGNLLRGDRLALAFMVSALPALLVVGIRRQMPIGRLAAQREGRVNRRLGTSPPSARCRPGPAQRRRRSLAVTTFNMAAYWFKTIWLPTYPTRPRRRWGTWRFCC